MDRAEQAELDAKLELAMPAGGSDQGVASAIELPPPPPAERVEPVVRRAPPQLPAPEPARITAPDAPPQPVEPVVIMEEEAVATSGPAHDHAPAEATGRTPLEAKGGRVARAEGDDDRAPIGRGILIRGGGHVDDDCKIHRPGGVAMTPPPPLINERVPQVGNVPLGGVREPTDAMGAPTSGGGRGTVGPGGIAGAGTIIGRGNHPTTSRGGIGSRGTVPSRGGMGSRGGMRGGIR